MIFQKFIFFSSQIYYKSQQVFHNQQIISMEIGHNIRFDEHISLYTNEVTTHSIKVKGTTLYYQVNIGQTIEVLSSQYEKITKSELNLNISGTKISKELPLDSFETIATQNILQTVLNYSPQEKITESALKSLNKQITILKEIIHDHRKDCVEKRVISVKLNINLINFQQKVVATNYEINALTTWEEIIISFSHKYKKECTLEQTQILDENNKTKIARDSYKQRILETGIQFQSLFTITYIPNNCFFKCSSRLIKKAGAQMQQPVVQQILLSKVKLDLQNGNKVDVLTYNPEQNKLQTADVNLIHEILPPPLLHHIVATSGEEQIELECSQNALLFSNQSTWILAKNAKVGYDVVGLSNERQLALYKIIKNQIRENKSNCYCLSSPRYENVILNNFIVHNKNSIKIKVYMQSSVCTDGSKEDEKNNKMQVNQINVYRDKKVRQIFGPHLKCYIIGNQLHQQANIGDYIFSNESIIFVCQQSKLADKLIISERNERNISFYDISLKQRSQLCHKWGNDNMGLTKNEIIQPEQLRALHSTANKKMNHIIIDKRGNFERFNYLRNIRHKYESDEEKVFNSYKHLVSSTNNQGNLDQKSFIGIKLYTQNNIYRDLNKFLYDTYGKPVKNLAQFQKWFPMVGWISKSLQSLPNFEGQIYRGMKDLKLQNFLGLSAGKQNQTVTLSAFTSGSIDQHVAKGFSNTSGCIIKMKVSSGKLIETFSAFPHEREVLLSPFTQFVILDYCLNSSPQTATLEQLPMPKLVSDKILYWVDDVPSGNRHICKSMFEPRGIQVVEVLNTRVMAIILKKYFWMLKVMGKKVVIISDMSRFENDKWNNQAGVQLFNLIYNTYGLSNKAIIYTMDVKSAREKLQAKGVNKSNWVVSADSQEIIKTVLQEFSRT